MPPGPRCERLTQNRVVTLFTRKYVVVHEMAQLIAPTHSERFVALLNEHHPARREARAELNELPLCAGA